MKYLVWSLAVAVVVLGVQAGAEDVTPLPNAHSHNDYEHDRPLLEALDYGFCNVEADVFAIDGELLVAHDRKDCDPERTLRKLYLDPLKARVEANGGRVYKDGPGFILLIDFKTGGDETYPILREQLRDYESMLTRFEDDLTVEGAVTIVLSGASPRDLVAAEKERFVGIDGRLPDLESNPSVHLVPLISSSWATAFRWHGRKEMPDEVFTKMKEHTETAHAQGRKIRYWAAPQNDYVWSKMQEANVDLLNTDHFDRLSKFLKSNE